MTGQPEDRDFSPVPAEYADMAWPELVALIEEHEAEEAAEAFAREQNRRG